MNSDPRPVYDNGLNFHANVIYCHQKNFLQGHYETFFAGSL